MTYDEFVKLTNQTFNNFNWRYGQCIMNVLHGASPQLYNIIIDTDKDCYNNDSIVNQTLEYIKSNWIDNN